MKLIHKFDRYFTLLFFVTIIAIMITSYVTFNKVIRNHVDIQHQATIPLFTLVTNEIIRPLTIAHFMANDRFAINYIQQETISQQALLDYLVKLSRTYNMLSFIAMEKHQYMIDSTGKVTSTLDSEWYQRMKVDHKNQFADIGNADDPHLYFDIKVHNEEGQFLGFTGVAIDLNYFAKRFSSYVERFGYQLYLVDEENKITLSSNHLMKTESHHRRDEEISITTMPWFDSFDHQQNNKRTSLMVDTDSGRVMVTKLAVPELNWELYLVAPPADQQKQYWQLFGSKIVIFILLALGLYYIFDVILSYFKKNLIRNAETDYLTQLPNRSYIHWQVQKIREQHSDTAVVLADIDKFKEINDQYGHLVGDEVLKLVAEKLTEKLRKIDIVGRWGGEEFIMLLPETDITQAKEIAERIRESIASTPFEVSSTNDSFNLTVSFGISEGNLQAESLNDIILRADKALYQAKANGRNKVETLK